MLGGQSSFSHIPFRDSKITRLLSESLSGNCKTTICACISPSLIHYDETFSTLLFASRAMEVRTVAQINERVQTSISNAMAKKSRTSIRGANYNRIRLNGPVPGASSVHNF